MNNLNRYINVQEQKHNRWQPGYEVSKKLCGSIFLKSIGNRKDTFFDPNTFSASAVNLSGCQLLNVYASYQYSDKWKWYVEAKNLLNHQYEEIREFSLMRLDFCTALVSYSDFQFP